MTSDEIKEVIEFIKELVKNKIDNDAKQGKDLLGKCLLYRKSNDCDNNHKNEVKSFIARIDKEYALFVRLFAPEKNLTVTGKKGPVNCKTIDYYSYVLERVKKLKDAFEKGKKKEKLLGDKHE